MSDLDEAALARWIARVAPDLAGPLTVTKFDGGQSNPTYRVETPGGAAVLRRKPFGALLPSAHAVEREYRLLATLYPTGFPAPRPIALCEDSAVIGASFYIMAMVEGRTFWNGALPEAPIEQRRPIYESMIDTLARLHQLDYAALGLADFGRPGNYFARQIERWTKQYRAAQTDEIASVERLIEWLPRTVPEQERSSIIHGDFRIDNLIYHARQPEVAAVIDWELATIGDPLADFIYLAMNWVLPADGRARLGELDLEQAGLPSLAEASDRYCAATGRAGLPDLHWYIAYNLFRLVGIVQGVKKRALDGNASNAQPTDVTARIAQLAETAWAQARLAGAPR